MKKRRSCETFNLSRVSFPADSIRQGTYRLVQSGLTESVEKSRTHGAPAGLRSGLPPSRWRADASPPSRFAAEFVCVAACRAFPDRRRRRRRYCCCVNGSPTACIHGGDDCGNQRHGNGEATFIPSETATRHPSVIVLDRFRCHRSTSSSVTD